MGLPEQLFKETCAFFDAEGIKYSVVDEADNLMKLLFSGRSGKEGGGRDTKLFIDFDEEAQFDGSVTVHFASVECATCENDNMLDALIQINELNKNYRWVKFWFDRRDNSFNADCDAVVFSGSAGKECLQYAIRMSSVIEDALIELKDIFTPIDDETPSRDDLLAMLEAIRGMLGE